MRKSIPKGNSLIFFLSLISDKDEIDVTLHRRVVMLLFPSVISLDTVVELGWALYPMKVLFEPSAKS